LLSAAVHTAELLPWNNIVIAHFIIFIILFIIFIIIFIIFIILYDVIFTSISLTLPLFQKIPLPDFLQMIGQGVRSSNGQTDSCGGTCLNHLSWLPKILVTTPFPPPLPPTLLLSGLLPNVAILAGFTVARSWLDFSANSTIKFRNLAKNSAIFLAFQSYVIKSRFGKEKFFFAIFRLLKVVV
jgi:hypothetical protein